MREGEVQYLTLSDNPRPGLLTTELTSTLRTVTGPSSDVVIVQHDPSFTHLIGPSPAHSLLLSTATSSRNPFFHEACVYIPAHEELYVTSSLLQSSSTSNYPSILISRLALHRAAGPDGQHGIDAVDWAKMRPPAGIDMPSGGANYAENSIIFCAQGNVAPGTGGIYHMPRGAPARPLVTNFHGRDFNSPRDVAVARDGAIWFTDPCHGYEQEIRARPKLPCAVWRFVPATGELRAVAEGLARPSGIAFSPDQGTCYVTDAGLTPGDGTTDSTR